MAQAILPLINGWRREMKKIILLCLAMVIMSLFLKGCFIGFEDREGRGRGEQREHGERHEEHHEERR